LEAELLACSEGLDLALRHSPLPLQIETDCFQLVAVANSTLQDRSPYVHIISEIRDLAKQGRICTFVKVDRRQVRASHCLANFARA
jgi:CDP-diacylglycerol pyrophosphatase